MNWPQFENAEGVALEQNDEGRWDVKLESGKIITANDIVKVYADPPPWMKVGVDVEVDAAYNFEKYPNLVPLAVFGGKTGSVTKIYNHQTTNEPWCRVLFAGDVGKKLPIASLLPKGLKSSSDIH